MRKSDQELSTNIYSLGKVFSLAFLTMAILGFLILLSPFFLPNIFKYETLGALGDAVGGFLNPLVAMAAALLTFLAFYVQYKANQYQKKSIEIQQKDIELERFENNFFEMLRLHKENINEMKIVGYDIDFTESVELGKEGQVKAFNRKRILRYVEGRKVFVSMKVELYACYQICNFFLDALHEDEVRKIAFKIFFFGINSNVLDEKVIGEKTLEGLNKVRDEHYRSYGQVNRYKVVD